MHDGWRQVESAGPLRRFATGLAVILLAVPLLVIGVIAVLVFLALGAASALVTFVLGGRKPTAGPAGLGPWSRPEDGRENVRVIPRDD